MYCCDTGSIPKIDVQHMTHVAMSVDEAQRIAYKLDQVRQESDDGNGELSIVIVGKMIKKIRTVCDTFYENISKKQNRRR